MSDVKTLPKPLIDTIAGFFAGIASTIVGHPLDVVKTRLQVDRTSSSQLGSSIRIVRTIVHNDGPFRGLYRGFTPNVIGNSVGWAAFFLWYGKTQDALQLYHGAQTSLSYYDHFLASGTAGILTNICTNPIWVIKTRMLSTSSTYPGAYTSISDGIRQILRTEGLLGFYRGLGASLLGVGHGAVYFAVYEPLKAWRARTKSGADPTTMDTLITSTVGKLIATTTTYPYQILRTRLQSYQAGSDYNGLRDVIRQIYRHEGIRGFYKGTAPGLARVLPSVWVTFVVAEKLKLAMSKGFLGEMG